MPEGHTIHRLAREFGERFAGLRVRASSPQGRFAAGAALIDGTALEHADAHGKHLFLGFSGEQWVHLHLGLYGRVEFGPAPAPAPRGAVRLRLSSVGSFVDVRGPNACSLIGSADKERLQLRLGPDPLRADADSEQAWRRVSRSRSPVATLLMDQSVVAGVGNIYRSEVLFRHGISPFRPGLSLTPGEWDAVWADLVSLMRYGVAVGRIDTVRDEHTPEVMGRPPRIDDHGGEVYVYRRAGQPCHVCQTPVRTRVLAARNLFWCPTCQKTNDTQGRG